MKKKDFYYDEKNPKCNEIELNENGYPVYKNNKHRLVHRYNAWRYLLHKKRPLREWEEVHHVDGDKLNYNPNNLVILSGKEHWKISKRLHKETNLNKANWIIFILAFSLFVWNYKRQFDYISKIIVTLLIVGIFIPFYSNITHWFMRKTKLYKVIEYNDK